MYRSLGLLPWLSVLSFVIAVTVHHYSRLPSPYTWLQPLSTLHDIFRKPYFPAVAAAVWGLGLWTRRGDIDPERAARRLASAIEPRAALRFAARPLIGICAVIFADSLLFQVERGALDLLSLALLGFALGRARVDRARALKLGGFTLLSVLIFLCICYCFTILKSLTFASGRSFDAAIIELEQALFGVVPHRVVAGWMATRPALVQLCDWIYFHFFEHMALTSVLLTACRKEGERTEYLAALALCYVIGGPVYHLLPARGPTYFDRSYYHFLERDGLTVAGIRIWLDRNTREVLSGVATEVRTWGYVACMPSLHIAQEVVMLFYARHSRLAFVLSLAFTLATSFAVVALGFHYPLDSLAGVVLAGLAIALSRWQREALMPRGLCSTESYVPAPAKPVIAPFFRAYFAARREGRVGIG